MVKYTVTAPSTPGAAPTVQGEAPTLRAARCLAVRISRGRRDLRGQDVRIERDGRLVEYAGVGA